MYCATSFRLPVHKRRCHPRRCVVARSSSLLVAFVFGFVPANPMPVGTLKQQQHFSSSSSSNNKNQQHNHKYRAIRKAHKTKRYQRISIEHATWQQRIEFKSDCSYRLVVVEPSTQTVRILACSVGKRSTLIRNQNKVYLKFALNILFHFLHLK